MKSEQKVMSQICS